MERYISCEAPISFEADCSPRLAASAAPAAFCCAFDLAGMPFSLPIFGGAVVPVYARFPVPIAPGIVTEGRRISELGLSDIGHESATRGIVVERRPWDWMWLWPRPTNPPKLITA